MIEEQVRADITELEDNPGKLVTMESYTLGVVTSFRETIAKVESGLWTPCPLTPVESQLMEMARAVKVRV